MPPWRNAGDHRTREITLQWRDNLDHANLRAAHEVGVSVIIAMGVSQLPPTIRGNLVKLLRAVELEAFPVQDPKTVVF